MQSIKALNARLNVGQAGRQIHQKSRCTHHVAHKLLSSATANSAQQTIMIMYLGCNKQCLTHMHGLMHAYTCIYICVIVCVCVVDCKRAYFCAPQTNERINELQTANNSLTCFHSCAFTSVQFFGSRFLIAHLWL